MSFFECQFPTKIAFGAVGGPSWSTIVNMGFSGFEQRNRNWSLVRNKYQLDLVAQPLSTFQTVMNFFLATGGKTDAFRFLDATDFVGTAQATSPATGNGANKIFQLQKAYTIGVGATLRTYTRTISKPIMSHQTNGGQLLTDFSGLTLADTVVMYLNGVKKTLTTDYTVDATTGLVTFVVAPGAGVNVAADFQFHMPVRFDNDDWPAQVLPSDVANNTAVRPALITVTGINLLEVRILAGASQG
jgi:hypothetical protein